jgi:hypothetical protein
MKLARGRQRMLEEDSPRGRVSAFAWETAFSFIVDTSRQSRNEDPFVGGHRVLAGLAETQGFDQLERTRDPDVVVSPSPPSWPESYLCAFLSAFGSI